MSLRAFALVLLTVVMLSPPLAMASQNCATMGADCEGPCGTSIAMPPAPDSAAAPVPVSRLEGYSRGDGPMLPLGVPELPPRPVPSLA